MAKAKKPRTVDVARELVAPLLEGTDLELWDLRFEKEGSEWFLRYFIDKPDGVTITDLETLNRALSKKLDEVDPIDHGYTLEVSSPGLERQLTEDYHFARYIGHPVNVRTIRPRDGQRQFLGILQSKDNDGLTLRLDDDGQITLQNAEIAWVRLHVDLESGGQEE